MTDRPPKPGPPDRSESTPAELDFRLDVDRDPADAPVDPSPDPPFAPSFDTSLDPVAIGRLAADLRLSCMRISRRVRFESAADQLPPHQFSALARLEQSPEQSATPGDLAQLERVSAPSMSRTIAALEAAGFIRRAPHPSDGRQVILQLTAQGIAELATIRGRRDLWMSSRLAGLDPEQIELLERAAPLLAQVATR